jgi:hypothetical protein
MNSESENENNTGPERRIEQRRNGTDRRDLIRYEREKNPRRKNNGRRSGELKDLWRRR